MPMIPKDHVAQGLAFLDEVRKVLPKISWAPMPETGFYGGTHPDYYLVLFADGEIFDGAVSGLKQGIVCHMTPEFAREAWEHASRALGKKP